MLRSFNFLLKSHLNGSVQEILREVKIYSNIGEEFKLFLYAQYIKIRGFRILYTSSILVLVYNEILFSLFDK